MLSPCFLTSVYRFGYGWAVPVDMGGQESDSQSVGKSVCTPSFQSEVALLVTLGGLSRTGLLSRIAWLEMM